MDHSLGGVTAEDASILTHLFLAFAVVENGRVTDRLITQMGEVEDTFSGWLGRRRFLGGVRDSGRT